ncbi:MAG: hypothetical protein COA58_06420 [Bacteroidetes bacterium]|nr:MAG: hypothetical protein COA58_06420 [Bacteroidota bacterium]
MEIEAFFYILVPKMRNTITLIFCFASFLLFAQRNNNEAALVIAPLKFKEQSSYQLLYRRTLSNELIKLRGGLRLLIDTDKEIRSDTLSNNQGSIQYDVSLGIQRDLSIGDLEKVNLYTGIDGYYNSEFNQKSYETYYGYYWSFGLKPLMGVSYEPFDNIRLSFESRANLNVNLQEYSASGVNKDERVSFRPLDQLAIGIGYLF